MQDFATIDSIRMESLSTCGTDVQSFQLNGVNVGGVNVNHAHCQCDPPISISTTSDAALLAAWDGSNLQANVGRYSKPGTSSNYLWAAITVTAGGDALRLCIVDRTGGGCVETNLCAANSTASVDVSNANAWNEAASGSLSYTAHTYNWDFGDGTSTGFQNVTNPRVLEATHIYNGTAGSPFTAKLTVCNSANECSSANYPVTIRNASLDTRINIAIDEGLWALHKAQQDSGQILTAGAYGSLPTANATALNAFFAHGHVAADEVDGVLLPRSSSNPYVQTVSGAMDYLFTKLQPVQISQKNTGDPDTNGNGIGITVSGRAYEIYQNGPIMDAIVASGTPGAMAQTGPADVRGRTYADIVQDMADGYAFGQMDANFAFPQRGSWNYTFGPGHADNSSSGWAAIGMLAAERGFGTTIPNFVKTENDQAVRAMWNANGTFGYASTACLWGCAGTTPHGMLQWNLDGRSSTDPHWLTSQNWISQNWGAGPTEANNNTVTGYTYSMYAVTKVLRLADPAVNTIGGNFDWYRDPVKGMAKTVVDRQLADGTWGTLGFTDIRGLATGWHTLMLAPALFEAGPKAVAAASPISVAINQVVTFDHSDSYHLDPSKTITQYAWDFDGDGTIDLTTGDANERPMFSYNPALNEVPKTYSALLTVSDGSLSNSATVDIVVDTGNVPPVAVITGSATGGVGRPVTLSGAESFDPNAGPPLDDQIVSYEWDMDDSDGLTQFVDLGAIASAVFSAPGDRQVVLRVTDSFGLQSVAFHAIHVPENAPPVALCRDVTVDADENGLGDADVDNGSSDADGDALTLTQNPAGPYGLGSTVVTLNVSDGQGTGSCTATVTVVDTVPPSLAGLEDQLLEATSAAGAEATFEVLATDIIDGQLAVSCSAGSGETFAMGATVVECTASDGSGNTASGSFIITVQDTIAPVLAELADQTLEAVSAAGASTTFAVTASDFNGDATGTVDPAPAVVCSATSGDTFAMGDTMVDCTATDASGNASSRSFTITVQDTIAPVLAGLADQTLEAVSSAGAPATFAVTASDFNADTTGTVDPAPAVVCSSASGDTFALGDTTVGCTATDAAGNTSIGSFTITVQDTIAPALSVPADITQEATAVLSGVNIGTATATDVVGPVTVTSDAPASYPLGATTVTWIAEDAYGNSTSAVQLMTVVDTTSPLILMDVPDVMDIPSSGEPVTLTATATDIFGASASINAVFCESLKAGKSGKNGTPLCNIVVEGAAVTITSESVSKNTAVTWNVTAIDGNGNTSTQTYGTVVSGKDTKEACNQGKGNGAEGCDPGNSNQGDPDNSRDEQGADTSKTSSKGKGK
ncbi:MAG: HYR domain-containing protein [Proteobacteria bacterium]|nr:HYR domain-containing protein [Pseudomonadota bacterium]